MLTKKTMRSNSPMAIYQDAQAENVEYHYTIKKSPRAKRV